MTMLSSNETSMIVNALYEKATQDKKIAESHTDTAMAETFEMQAQLAYRIIDKIEGRTIFYETTEDEEDA